MNYSVHDTSSPIKGIVLGRTGFRVIRINNDNAHCDLREIRSSSRPVYEIINDKTTNVAHLNCLRQPVIK